MDRLRVFFYGLIAFARRSNGDVVAVLLDKRNHGHGHGHEPYIAFNADCTGDCPPSGQVECAELPKRLLAREDIILSYASQNQPHTQPNPPSSHLPNSHSEGRHIKWVPKVADLMHPVEVNWDAIGRGSGLVARMEINMGQFARMQTCRIVEHEHCYVSDVVVHPFEFLPPQGSPAHKLALAEVVVFEDRFSGGGVDLTIRQFSATTGGDSFRLSTSSGNSTIDIFVANLPGNVHDECADRQVGEHFDFFYDLLVSPVARPRPNILKGDFRRSRDVAPDCGVTVLCVGPGGDLVSRNLFDEIFKSPNSRPVCPMVVLEDAT